VGYRSYQWPGHGLPNDRPYQYLDHENMRAEEYDDFIEDPSWFYFTRYLPRVCEAYEPLAKLPQLAGRTSVRIPFFSRHFGDPQVAAALVKIAAVGEEATRMLNRASAFDQELKELGFPLARHASSTAPYDYFGDFLRGSKGIMLDLFRRKDKLLEAMERVVPMLIRDAVQTARVNSGNIVFIPLHWGLDGFMSPKQFTTFYWPQLQKVILALIDAGMYPHVLWEGDCGSRLDVIRDVPKGKCVYFFERTDLFRAKEVLRDRVCIRGGIPAATLIAGTPAEVRERCKKLFDAVGDGGGFILDASVGVPDEARPENVRAMFECAKECVY